MLKINIKVFANLGEILGFNSLEINVPSETVGKLIGFISNKYDQKFEKLLIDSETGELRKSYIVLVNGRNINFLNGLKTVLKNDDEIAVFPPTGGG